MGSLKKYVDSCRNLFIQHRDSDKILLALRQTFEFYNVTWIFQPCSIGRGKHSLEMWKKPVVSYLLCLKCQQGFTTFSWKGREFSICKTLKQKRKIMQENLYYKCNFVSITTYSTSNSKIYIYIYIYICVC